MLDTKKAMAIADEAIKVKPKEEPVDVKAEAKAEPKVEETKGTPESTGDSKVAKETPKGEPGAAVETKEAQPATKEETAEKKPHFSNQKQIDYAFQKEKAKRKALQAKYEATQKELEELKARNPQPEQFKSQADYVNLLVDMKTKENEQARLQEQIQESQYEEYNRLNNARIESCFPEQSEQEKFRAIVATEGPKLLKKLDEADPEQAVLSYLDDSDIAPLLTRLLIAEPAYLDAVLAKRSPYGKYQEMSKLAERVEFARTKLAEKTPDVSRETPVETKPAIPVIGSVTKSEATKETKQVFDPNELLRKLKSKNKYHK